MTANRGNSGILIVIVFAIALLLLVYFGQKIEKSQGIAVTCNNEKLTISGIDFRDIPPFNILADYMVFIETDIGISCSGPLYSCNKGTIPCGASELDEYCDNNLGKEFFAKAKLTDLSGNRTYDVTQRSIKCPVKKK